MDAGEAEITLPGAAPGGRPRLDVRLARAKRYVRVLLLGSRRTVGSSQCDGARESGRVDAVLGSWKGAWASDALHPPACVAADCYPRTGQRSEATYCRLTRGRLVLRYGARARRAWLGCNLMMGRGGC